jgi:thymidine phosphorylase
MEALVEMAVQGNVDDEEIAHLTCCLAESGIRLDIPELGTVTDIASTGGLASLKKGGNK